MSVPAGGADGPDRPCASSWTPDEAAAVAADDRLLERMRIRGLPSGHDGEVTVEMPLLPDRLNIRGHLLGGLVATLIDTAAGTLGMMGVPEGFATTTTEMTVHYLSPVSVGPARATARVLRRGRKLIVLDVELVDAGRSDKLAAVGRVSFMIVPLPTFA